jgi:hypothetical protein
VGLLELVLKEGFGPGGGIVAQRVFFRYFHDILKYIPERRSAGMERNEK